MKYSPHYLFVCWFAAATFGAVAGIAGFMAFALVVTS